MAGPSFSSGGLMAEEQTSRRIGTKMILSRRGPPCMLPFCTTWTVPAYEQFPEPVAGDGEIIPQSRACARHVGYR